MKQLHLFNLQKTKFIFNEADNRKKKLMKIRLTFIYKIKPFPFVFFFIKQKLKWLIKDKYEKLSVNLSEKKCVAYEIEELISFLGNAFYSNQFSFTPDSE